MQQLIDDPVLTLLLLVGILLAFALHEMGHAFSAWAFGDPTPREHGRITLNPIAHLDPVGTIMLVVSFLLLGFPFGFAVTPINESKMRRPRLHGVLVALAGPLMNLLILVACLVGVILGARGLTAGEEAPMWLELLFMTATFNAFLIVFNLLPVPPLDGSRVVGGLMDDHTRHEWRKLDQYGIFIILALVFILGGPFQQLVSQLQGALLDLVVQFVGRFVVDTGAVA